MISFYSCNPNPKFNPVIVASSKANAIAYLNANYLLYSYTEDKYEILTNTLKVAAVSTPTVFNPLNAKYLLYENAEEKRFYFVEKCTYVSGYFVFELSLDLFATYYYEAAMDFSIVASNVLPSAVTKISFPYYGEQSPIEASAKDIDQSSIGFNALTGILNDLSKMCVAFGVTYSTQVMPWEVDTKGTLLVAITLKEWKDYLTITKGLDLTGVSDKTIARSLLSFVSNITYITMSPYDPLDKQDARVTSCYLIPSDMISRSASIPFHVLCLGKEPILNTNDLDIAAYLVEKGVAFNLPDVAVAIDEMPYLHVGLDYVPLNSFVPPAYTDQKKITGVSVRVYTEADGLSIRVHQGNFVQDITNAFKYNIQYVNDNAQGLNRLNAITSNLIKIGGAIASAIATEGATTPIALATTFTGGVDILSTIRRNSQPSGISSAGDVMATFFEHGSYVNAINAPFEMAIFEMPTKPLTKAISDQGVNYFYHSANATTAKLYELYSYDLIKVSLYRFGIYARFMVSYVEKVPAEAAAFIKDIMESGLRIEIAPNP